MRARGAQVTDIGVGGGRRRAVMPQTVRRSTTPRPPVLMIVINKCDKPTATQKVRTDLCSMRLWSRRCPARCRMSRSGPDRQACPNCWRRSPAAEILELKALTGCQRGDRGQADVGRGPVATVLVQNGTRRRRHLRRRRKWAASARWSTTRARRSRPVLRSIEVLGLNGTPSGRRAERGGHRGAGLARSRNTARRRPRTNAPPPVPRPRWNSLWPRPRPIRTCRNCRLS